MAAILSNAVLTLFLNSSESILSGLWFIVNLCVKCSNDGDMWQLSVCIGFIFPITVCCFDAVPLPMSL